MGKLVNELKMKINHKEYMIGTTAPSYWFDGKFTEQGQKEWDDNEILEISELKDAIKCLTDNGF